MSNLYREKYVIRGEQVRRVINVNDRIAEKMQAIVEEQQRAQKEEMLRRRKETMEADGENVFTEGLFAEELSLEPEPEPEIDYVEQAKEQAAQIVSEAETQAAMIHDQAMKDADTLREMARQEGYQNGYESAVQEAERQLQMQKDQLAQQEQELQLRYKQAMEQLEPELLDTILTVFDEVFRIQFSGKREMLLHLVMNAMRGIRETRRYKIRVSEADVLFLRECKEQLQEKVGADVMIEIVMDPLLSENQCMIDADSGVYDCSLDVELDNLTRDLKSLCVSGGSESDTV